MDHRSGNMLIDLCELFAVDIAKGSSAIVESDDWYQLGDFVGGWAASGELGPAFYVDLIAQRKDIRTFAVRLRDVDRVLNGEELRILPHRIWCMHDASRFSSSFLGLWTHSAHGRIVDPAALVSDLHSFLVDSRRFPGSSDRCLDFNLSSTPGIDGIILACETTWARCNFEVSFTIDGLRVNKSEELAWENLVGVMPVPISDSLQWEGARSDDLVPASFLDLGSRMTLQLPGWFALQLLTAVRLHLYDVP